MTTTIQWYVKTLVLAELQKYTYACGGREAIISSTKSKQSYFQSKTKFLSYIYWAQSMCDNFKCYILTIVDACRIVVHKWVWMPSYRAYFILVSFGNLYFYYFCTSMNEIIWTFWLSEWVQRVQIIKRPLYIEYSNFLELI